MIARLPLFGLLTLIALAPLPLGMVPPVTTSLAGLWLASLLAIWTILAGCGRVRIVWRRSLAVPLLLIAGVTIWMLVQTYARIDPTPLARAAAQALHRPVPSFLTLAPAQGRVALLGLLTPVAVFWLSLQHGRDPRDALRVLGVIVVAQAIYAAYGLVEYIGGNARLLWFARWAYLGDVTGTLVNRNNYATLAGLGLMTACALAWRSFLGGVRRSPAVPSRFVRSVEAVRGRPALLLFAVAVIGMAWLQSHSRMGFISTALGMAAMLALGIVRMSPRRWWIALLLAGAGGASLLAVSGGGTLDRIDSGGGGDRYFILATSARAAALAPWAGSGGGAFSDAFAQVRDASLPQDVAYAMAHNSYLQAAVEFGIPAAVALVLAMLWLIGLCLWGSLRRRRDRLFPVLGVGAGILVGVHSLLDFSIQIPAVAIVFAAIQGVAVAQSFPSEPDPAQ